MYLLILGKCEKSWNMNLIFISLNIFHWWHFELGICSVGFSFKHAGFFKYLNAPIKPDNLRSSYRFLKFSHIFLQSLQIAVVTEILKYLSVFHLSLEARTAFLIYSDLQLTHSSLNESKLWKNFQFMKQTKLIYRFFSDFFFRFFQKRFSWNPGWPIVNAV